MQGPRECHGNLWSWRKIQVRYGNFKTPTAPLSSGQTAGPGVNALKPENVVFLLQANNTTTTSDTIVERTGRGTITVSGTLPYSQTQTLSWTDPPTHCFKHDVSFVACSELKARVA